MTNQQRDVHMILSERIELIQRISAANCECLRLNQIANGLMILDQMDEAEGGEMDVRTPERIANAEAVEDCMNRIEAFERQLAELDRELAKNSERD